MFAHFSAAGGEEREGREERRRDGGDGLFQFWKDNTELASESFLAEMELSWEEREKRMMRWPTHKASLVIKGKIVGHIKKIKK